MKRTVPLRRTGRLATVTPLTRSRMPARVAGLNQRRRRHMATDTPAVYEDLTRRQRALLYARYAGRCEGALVPDCWGRPPDDLWQAGHRRNRSQGGSNTTLSNRWAGCPPCHRWQTDHSDEAAETGHYIRRTGLDPRRMPMCLPDGRIVRLDDHGRYEEVS